MRVGVEGAAARYAACIGLAVDVTIARPCDAAMANPVEATLDELYGVSPADFIATRDVLVKKLKGDPRVAELRDRRKPTQTAYTLNELARRYLDGVRGVVDAGRGLGRAQRKALRGEASDDLREAISRQRIVIRELRAKVGALVKELGVEETHLAEIASALQAALVDPGMGEALETGREREAARTFSRVPVRECGCIGVPDQPGGVEACCARGLGEAEEARRKSGHTR